MNSLVDPYDRRIFRGGQEVGVKYGGTVHQPTITYETIPPKLPDPRPSYGDSSPPVVYDNTEPTFIDRINRASLPVGFLAQANPSITPGQKFLFDYIGNLFTGGAGLKKQLNEEIIPNINRHNQAIYDAMKETGVGRVPPGY